MFLRVYLIIRQHWFRWVRRRGFAKTWVVCESLKLVRFHPMLRVCKWQVIKSNSLTHLPQDKMAASLADDNFKCIFLNENVWIVIQISLKFVPKDPIDNKPALVQKKRQAITWSNAHPVHQCHMVMWYWVHWCIYAALGGEELSCPWQALNAGWNWSGFMLSQTALFCLMASLGLNELKRISSINCLTKWSFGENIFDFNYPISVSLVEHCPWYTAQSI